MKTEFKNVNDFFQCLCDSMPRFTSRYANKEEAAKIYADNVKSLIKSIIVPNEVKKFNWNAHIDAEYWMRGTYPTDAKDINDACKGIVFNAFCILDGVSSQNDFNVVKTIFDDEIGPAGEFHSLWCKFTPNEEHSCVIRDSELDEKGADGIWDLAAEICDDLHVDIDDCLNDAEPNQECIYNTIRDYLGRQNYCPECGRKLNKKEE